MPPRGLAVWLLRGPRVEGDGFTLCNDSLGFRPATRDNVDQLLARVGSGWEVLPREAMTVVTTSFNLESRNHPMPSFDAVFQAMAVQQELLSAIWLTTGCRPSWIVRWMGEVAHFPTMADMHELRSPLESATDDLCPVETLDASRIEPAFRLLHDRQWLGVDNERFDFETSESLRSAFYAIDAADRSIDAMQLLVHAYSVLQGMLSRPVDEDTKVIRRATDLMSSSVKGSRVLSKRLNAVRIVRNKTAHGLRPSWDEAQAAAGLSALDPLDLVDRHTLERELRRQAREYLRCGFGSVLWLTVETRFNDGKSSSFPRMSKRDLIEMLDNCASKIESDRSSARRALETLVPLWLRDPIGRDPA